MPRQLTFDLPVRPVLGREEFYVSPSNRLALDSVEAWQGWPARKLMVTGPAGAGKTHLAHVWADITGARIVAAGSVDRPVPGSPLVIEDCDRVAGDAAAEEALFHLHNQVLDHGGHLLMTGRGAPSGWGITLPDLASRLTGTPMVAIDLPDDALLAAVLVKAFDDRQLIVPPNVIEYLAPRIGRSFAAVLAIADQLDRAALAVGRAITRSLAAAILDKRHPDEA